MGTYRQICGYKLMKDVLKDILYIFRFIKPYKTSIFALLLFLMDWILYRVYHKLFSLTDTLDREQSIFIYCVHTSRSITVCELLKKRGFINVFLLVDGITGWKIQELETDKKRIRKKEKKDSKNF